MSAETELVKLSEIQELDEPHLHVKELISDVDQQVKRNLVSQFGITRFLDDFKVGGGVDTIHNVRAGIYSSEGVAQQLKDETSGYDKDVARTLHGGSAAYKEINRQQTELKKKHQLTDVNTGKLLKANQQTDLDHTVATKTIWEDQGRVLAGLSADEIANSKDNLHLTDKSINRSMGAQDKTEYAKDLSRKKAIWKKQNSLDQNDSNLSNSKKRSKAENTRNRLAADEQAIKENDLNAKHAIDKKINQYYRSEKFLKGTFVNSASQGLKQSGKAVIGIILYQVEDAIIKALVKVINQWETFNSVKERFDSLIQAIKNNLATIDVRVNSIEDAAVSGLTGGFMGAVTNTIVNAFSTTAVNIAKLLNDSLISLVQAAKILCVQDAQITLRERTNQATKIITAALVASLGVMLGDVLSKDIMVKFPVLAPVSDLIGNLMSAVISGGLTAMLIYTMDNWSQILLSVKEQFDTFMVGLTVSPKTIEASYQQAIAKVETLYQELLVQIYQRYAETNRLQQLAYDMDLPTADQFVASGDLAQHMGVDQQQILRNRSDVNNYFNS
ncbi:hypothetical protein N692_03745 [Lactiplantibacillus plantarum EGD-AQ4]|nr:hypothetical protein N692_03745 [Lactiplantibacillus plantarum EGD-AQ4]